MSGSAFTLKSKPPGFWNLAGLLREDFSAHLQATDFLFHVFAGAVVSWGDHVMPLLFGLRAEWLPWRPEDKPRILKHCLYGNESDAQNALPSCLLGMPLSLAQLLGKEPWSSQTHKVGNVFSTPHINPEKKVNDDMFLSTVVHRLAPEHYRRSWAEFFHDSHQHSQRYKEKECFKNEWRGNWVLLAQRNLNIVNCCQHGLWFGGFSLSKV